ncbi:hypothetical protein B0H13DRAFT_2305661 [Mycena leptocephala]|nr:hypothetical protein B0H13DRAFT_2305661 [Mycena leptocephala]
MLVIDPMHCILEGPVHHHCRRLLNLNLADAKQKLKSAPAYAHDFPSLDTVVEGWKLNERQAKSVEAIHRHLVYQLAGATGDDDACESGDNESNDEDDNVNDNGFDNNDSDDNDPGAKAKAKAKSKDTSLATALGYCYSSDPNICS